MKQKLCLGNCYALTKHKLHQLNIRNFSLLAVLTIMCLYAVKQVSAQQAEPAATAAADIKPLQIGDTIPEWLWNLPLQVANHPKGRETIALKDYRGKAIILDFLSTTCRGCIEALPKLEQTSLANGDVSVIAVTSENRERVTNFVSNNNYVSGIQLPFVLEDRVLKKYFPHLYISHVVWIDAQNTVRAFTGTKHVTPHTIREMQSGADLDWPVKTEQTVFFNEPLVELNHKASSLPHNVDRHLLYAGITGYTEGVGPYVSSGVDSIFGIKRISIKNMAIIDLYRIAVGNEFPSKKQIRLEVEHPERYAFWLAEPDSRQTEEQWYRMYSICYESTFPIDTEEEVRHSYMLADLNRFLNLNGRIEYRADTAYFILSEQPQRKNL